MGGETSKTDQVSGYDTYYHYTDKDSAKKILDSGKIKQSDQKNGDAVYGNGTYVTKMSPKNPKEDIMKNNYDGSKSFQIQNLNNGKADVAIEVKLPTAKVQDCSGGGRDVHLHKGDIDLNSGDVEDVKVHVVGPTGELQTFQK